MLPAQRNGKPSLFILLITFKHLYIFFFLACLHPKFQAFTTQRHLRLCKLFIIFLDLGKPVVVSWRTALFYMCHSEYVWFFWETLTSIFYSAVTGSYPVAFWFAVTNPATGVNTICQPGIWYLYDELNLFVYICCIHVVTMFFFFF